MELIGERVGNNISFWERSAQKFRSAPLYENLRVDVCVVGAGIAGMTTGYCWRAKDAMSPSLMTARWVAE